MVHAVHLTSSDCACMLNNLTRQVKSHMFCVLMYSNANDLTGDLTLPAWQAWPLDMGQLACKTVQRAKACCDLDNSRRCPRLDPAAVPGNSTCDPRLPSEL